MAERPVEEPSTGEERLHNLFKYLTAKQNPDEPVPPVPAELREWARSTSQMALVGICLGMYTQWRREREAGPIVAPPEAPTPAHAARWIAEAKTQRLIRLCNRATGLGLRVGALSAVYFSAELLLRIYDGESRPRQAGWAGAATGAVFGFASNVGLPPGVPATRLLSAGLMGALGAGAGWCAGLADRTTQAMLPEDVRRQKEDQWQQMLDITAGKDMTPAPPVHPASNALDVTAAVIAALEANLPRKKEEERALQAGDLGEEASREQKKRLWWKLW